MRRGEILKLGRVRLKVKELRLGNAEEDKDFKQIDYGPIDTRKCNDTPNDENDVCRICFNNTNIKENPLFAPCNCTGTMKFIHHRCLKVWLNSKLNFQPTPQLYLYRWKSFECEICKTIYPCNYNYNLLVCIEHLGIEYPLTDVYKPPAGDYIIFESLIHEKNALRIVNVVIPDTAKNTFRIGRGNEADLKINDISVSRLHAQLKCTPDGYFIEDNNSKFGTLALVPNLEINPQLSRAVQIGRTVISLSVKPTELDP